jgi:hypothetical protein
LTRGGDKRTADVAGRRIAGERSQAAATRTLCALVPGLALLDAVSADAGCRRSRSLLMVPGLHAWPLSPPWRSRMMSAAVSELRPGRATPRTSMIVIRPVGTVLLAALYRS